MLDDLTGTRPALPVIFFAMWGYAGVAVASSASGDETEPPEQEAVVADEAEDGERRSNSLLEGLSIHG